MHKLLRQISFILEYPTAIYSTYLRTILSRCRKLLSKLKLKNKKKNLLIICKWIILGIYNIKIIFTAKHSFQILSINSRQIHCQWNFKKFRPRNTAYLKIVCSQCRNTFAKAQKTYIGRAILNKKLLEWFPSAAFNKSDKLESVFREATLRCRWLLKLNCIINASRTISDGLYGNLRRRTSVEIRKGITTPCHNPGNRRDSLSLSFSLFALCYFAGQGIYTINSLICRAHVGFRR